MQYKISAPHKIDAKVELPSSKSICNRALLINALSGSEFQVENLSKSDDSTVLQKALYSHENLKDIGAAGTSMRFLTAYLALKSGEYIITGSERMKKRPISILVEALEKLGAQIEYLENNGFPPLKITGKRLIGKPISLNSNVSSQYISALLMIAPEISGGLSLTLEGETTSRPYIEMTLKMMAEYGIRYWIDGNHIRIPEQNYIPIKYKIESDWSAASYWFQVVSLCENSKILLPGLLQNSLQGDQKVAEIFKQFGVFSDFTTNGLNIFNNRKLVKQFEYNFSDQPDLAQTLAVTSAMLNIPFRFSGLKTLRIKETDRIQALINELAKFGYKLIAEGDEVLYWNGEKETPSGQIVVNTYEDHRMAMAFAPTAFFYPDVIIDEPGVVSKSYPNFWEDLKNVGFKIVPLK